MISAAQLARAARFAARLYRERGVLAYHGYVRHDPMSQLWLQPARDDPYPIYERLRADGPLLRTRLGNWVTTSHDLCSRVLRERRFAVRPEDAAPPDGFGLSFLELNPPDHTRLRRIAAPAFSPRRMTGYGTLIDATVHRLIDELPRDRPVDLVTSFAGALPIAVISDLLGVPNGTPRTSPVTERRSAAPSTACSRCGTRAS